MAKYRLYKNKNVKSTGYNKYYAKKAAGKQTPSNLEGDFLFTGASSDRGHPTMWGHLSASGQTTPSA